MGWARPKITARRGRIGAQKTFEILSLLGWMFLETRGNCRVMRNVRMNITPRIGGNQMDYHIEFTDDLMTVLDEDGNGRDAHVVDPSRPWDAVEALVRWGREYDLDAVDALRELRQHLKACR